MYIVAAIGSPHHLILGIIATLTVLRAASISLSWLASPLLAIVADVWVFYLPFAPFGYDRLTDFLYFNFWRRLVVFLESPLIYSKDKCFIWAHNS